MSVEPDINAVMKRWRIGVKSKMRGIANFTEKAKMRFDVVESLFFEHRHLLDEWQMRRCRYLGPGPDGQLQYDFIDADWQDVRIGQKWGTEGISAFFRKTVRVPEAFDGRQLILRMYIGGDAMLKVNGVNYHALDPFHNEVVLCDRAAAGEEYRLEIEAYVAYHAEADRNRSFDWSEFVAVDDQVRQAYWDLHAAAKLMDIVNIDPKLRDFLEQRVWEAMSLIPLQHPDRGHVRQCVLDAAARVRQTVLESGFMTGQGKQFLVGHSHLDVVFMWQQKEYIRKVGRTHASMLRLMERYPQFKFSQSQAKIYADMKRYFPDIYAQVKQRIAEGRWEPIGAFWVEPDCNLISGESFVRQTLYGQKFLREEFGLTSRTCWQPDVFGLSYAMPQILARSGIRYFLTNKMVPWNDTNPWRTHTFWWEGPEGSRVLAIVPPGHFIGTVDPDLLDTQWRNFSDKDTLAETLHIFGWGDGGGGPDAEMLESAVRYAGAVCPGLQALEFATAEEAFDSIARRVEQIDEPLPVWRDELYLEAHRGTFTTKGRLKNLNRRAELMLRDIELLASAAAIAGASYPAEAIEALWKDVLTNQFHDSLPGTHIPEVYTDLLADYERINAAGRGLLDAASLAAAGPEGPSGVAIVNTQVWSRADTFVVEDAAGKVVLDGEAPLVQQRVTGLDGSQKLLVKLPTLPALSVRHLRLAEGEPGTQSGAVAAGENWLENDLLRLELDEQGHIVSLVDKRQGVEVLAGPANVLQMFEDTPGRYDAWDIVETYMDHPIEIPAGATITIDEAGPLRASLLVEKTLGRSTMRQRISLVAGLDRVLFETEIDWKERQRLLKAAFPVTVKADRATYDMAFGHISRPTHRNTSYDRAKFEVPAHWWMDLSQHDRGVAILNDCKYGCDIRDNVMRLTLLKGSIYPDPHADEEIHRFTYALMPHAGDWRTGGVLPAAWQLNNVLVARPSQKTQGQTPLATVEGGEGLTLEALKRAEDGDGFILRMVERRHAAGRGRVRFSRPVVSAELTDLMEASIGPAAVEDGAVCVTAGPSEIVTLRVRFQ